MSRVGDRARLGRELHLALAEASPRSCPEENTRWTSLRPARTDEHLLALAEHADALEVAHREPVRVGRDQTHAVGGRGEQHTGEDRAGVVTRRRRGSPGAAPRRTGSASTVTADALGLADPRELVGRQQPDAGPGRAGRDPGVVALDLEGHRPRPSAGWSARRTASPAPLPRPSVVDLGRDLHPDREIQVRADELDGVVLGRDLDARTAPGARRCGPRPPVGRCRSPRRGCRARSGTSPSTSGIRKR